MPVKYVDQGIAEAVRDVAEIRELIREQFGFFDWAQNSISEEILARYVAAAVEMVLVNHTRKI